MLAKTSMNKMNEEQINNLINLINRIEITKENEKIVRELGDLVEAGKFSEILQLLNKVKKEGKIKLTIREEEPSEYIIKPRVNKKNKEKREEEIEEETPNYEGIYPEKLSNIELEEKYISLLFDNPKAISMYYIVHDDCYFESDKYFNLYKSVLFTEGQAYAPQIAKDDFSFAKEDEETYKQKKLLKEKAKRANYDFEKIYVELRKLFEIRKNYLKNPIKETQGKIVGILDYELYDKMDIQEVKDAIEQITATEKFKRAVLNDSMTNFLIARENNLTTGLQLPFSILSSVFKGIRKGETMAYAMPSNSGKSRFTINLAAYIAFIHQKKVLIISNEMSEEKMKLCLMTTVLNNKEIQKLHGKKISKTEGELLEFKFKPDEGANVKVDENG